MYWNLLRAQRLQKIGTKTHVLKSSSVSFAMVDVSLSILLMKPEKFPEILALIWNVANVIFREYLGVLPPVFSDDISPRYLKVSRYVLKYAHCRHMCNFQYNPT